MIRQFRSLAVGRIWYAPVTVVVRSVVNKSTCKTRDDRRKATRRWENAFYGKIHYEAGMRERYASSVEEEERINRELEEDAKMQQEINGEVFPPIDGSSVALSDLRQMPEEKVRKYIIDRFVRAQRRIEYAPDFGSLFVMQHLNNGEEMLNEAEELLNEFGMMNAALGVKIEELRETLYKVKFDFDLD